MDLPVDQSHIGRQDLVISALALFVCLFVCPYYRRFLSVHMYACMYFAVLRIKTGS